VHADARRVARASPVGNVPVTLKLRIAAAIWEAPNILSYDLRPPEGGALPPFTAGAHIELILPSGLVRAYSLLNPQTEVHRYVIAVQKDRASRGGSKWVHENFRAGDIVTVNAPRNNFPLDESAESSIFIAGGIGITPILGMVDRLSVLGRDWKLVYCTRKRADTAFLDLLQSKPQVRFNFDEEPGGKMLDIAALVQAAPRDTHFYCCGPLPMLDAFEQATKDLPRERVHLEYFTAKMPPMAEGGFTVVLAKSGRELVVLPGKTILETLIDAGIDAPSSCSQGVCGSCETKVLDGIPDHRDVILTKTERMANNKMMICCSGSKSEKLVLDV
jgi:tetrachlorobenzoquinone reductase